MKLFSIVTVVLNHPEGLRRTAKSIKCQSSDDFEWILVDGGSDKPTLNVIEDFRELADIVISEKDNGIYDAMNKGARRSSGKWLIFLNAGDCFSHNYALASFRVDEKTRLAYGHAWWRSQDGLESFFKSKPLDELWKGICFSHQSLFMHREIIEEPLFQVRYKIAADYGCYVKAICSGVPVENLNYAVSIVEAGGISDRSFARRTLERLSLAVRYFGITRTAPFYIYLLTNHYRKSRRNKRAGL